MVEANAKFQHHTSEISPAYVDPDQKSDTQNVRLRHNRVDYLIKFTSTIHIRLYFHSQSLQ